MPCPCPAVPSPVVALAGWCPLSPAGAQSTQLLVEPSCMPAVLWDRVTLTCQGSGTAGATTWYKDGRLWGQEGQVSFTVTESGTYQCQKPGSRPSPPVMVSNEPLVLQAPARALLEGDTVTLRCRGSQDNAFTMARFYQNEKELGGSLRGTELSLPPLRPHNSGRYRCGVLADSRMSLSAPVTVAVHGEHPHGWNPNILTPPKPLLSGLIVTVPPPSPSQISSWCRSWRVPPSSPRGPPSISAASAPPAPCGPEPPSCTASTGTGSWWGARRGPRSSWCPPWGSPTRGITAARCAPRGGPCGRAAPGSASRCAVSAGMGTGSPHSPPRSPIPAETSACCPPFPALPP
uniref:Ig-like domain-containing protein n=1 Tax=Ficedula albicollis TaxID=59894 RepID=A0A803VFP5_FICAL